MSNDFSTMIAVCVSVPCGLIVAFTLGLVLGVRHGGSFCSQAQRQPAGFVL